PEGLRPADQRPAASCLPPAACCTLQSSWFDQACGKLSPRSEDSGLALLLGIDVGTGGTRALAIDATGRIVASATNEHAPFASPRTGWAEQDPHDWWRAAREAIRRVLASPGVSADAITAIGFSGQMHGSTLLDAKGEVVRPALLWCDQRTHEQCAQITDRIGAARLIELTLNPALTGFTAPKLLWVRQHEPDLWKQV